MNRRSSRLRSRWTIAAALTAAALHAPTHAADIDIYASTGSGAASNVLFFLDNTSNWSAQQQGWVPMTSWNRCQERAKPLAQKEATELLEACQAVIRNVFYQGLTTQKFPWEPGYNVNYWNNNKLPQGVVEVRSIKLVLKALVCDVEDNPKTAQIEKPLSLNVGLSLFGSVTGSERNSGDAVGVIYHAVQPLVGPSTGGTCKQILQKLDDIDLKIQDPQFKAPSSANYGAAFYEVFKYFGGYTNPDLAKSATPVAGSPVGATGYGSRRFSKAQPLDDANALQAANPLLYKSPIPANGACGNNYLILVGNTYPNAESNAGPTRFGGLNYTPPALSATSSDTSRFADEWSYFLANTDVSEAEGVQRVFTYAVNVYNEPRSQDPSQTKLLKSIAAVGGVGGSGYVEVGGDLYALVKAFEGMLLEAAAVDSVFTAVTLPVSTTTQGTFLNQVFVGMFRPDAQFSPRWVGNLKQYELKVTNGVLDLVDAKGDSAVLGGSGFFSPLAASFWTQDGRRTTCSSRTCRRARPRRRAIARTATWSRKAAPRSNCGWPIGKAPRTGRFTRCRRARPRTPRCRRFRSTRPTQGSTQPPSPGSGARRTSPRARAPRNSSARTWTAPR